MRSDALRNRERVITAARAVFAERGLGAGVPEVAERAGVGKATVYRSYPTREHLVAAIVINRLEWFAATARAALGADDPAEALGDVLLAWARRASADRSLAGAFAMVSEMPGVAEAHDAVRAALGDLITTAQEAGSIRADVTYADVKVLFGGVCHAADDEAALQRATTLVLDALRPGGRDLGSRALA